MASLPNAKFSGEKPFLVRRYNYRYGIYNGKKTLTLLIELSQEKNATMWQKIMVDVKLKSG
jgi:hypothetical protein